MPASPLTLLVAEDDDGHAHLLQAWLRKLGLAYPLRRFHDGQETLQFLSAAKQPADPWVLLLDIRMPKVDGIEVLKQVKSDQHWQHLPVIMMTTTDDPQEMARCQRLGCMGYVVKPAGREGFAQAVHQLKDYLDQVEVA